MRVLAPNRLHALDELRLRLAVMARRPQLDRALAEGADAGADPALALRAHQLTELSTRRALARTLGNLLDAAEEHPSAWRQAGPRPPLQREAVCAARDELVALADRLRHRNGVSPQACALAAQLVWDSASPMYSAVSDVSVAEWARTILDALVTEIEPGSTTRV